MRRYLLPIGLAVLSFGVVLPGMLFYLAQELEANRAAPDKPAVPAAKLQIKGEEALPQAFDEKDALRISQAAIGNQLGDYTLLDRSGRKIRSEERRVGKECRSRWSPYH